jgi:hypothetical protein
MDKGIFATINQTLDSQTATELARGFGAETAVISYDSQYNNAGMLHDSDCLAVF